MTHPSLIDFTGVTRIGFAPALSTPRFHLRPFAPPDAAAVFDYARQPGFFLYLDHVPLRVRQDYRMADAEEHLCELALFASAGLPSWAVVPQGGVPVGSVRFHRGLEGSSDPELGYAIDPRAWGQGIASEAVRAVLDWVGARVPRVVARAHRDNLASRRVLERTGFQPTGTDSRGRLSFCWTAPNLNPAATSPGTA